MLRKARYHHYRSTSFSGDEIGFSILMSPVDQTHVDVRVTYKSPKDHFCRKDAHASLTAKPDQRIAVKDLPAFMAQASFKCHHDNRGVSLAAANRFAWIWKYFL